MTTIIIIIFILLNFAFGGYCLAMFFKAGGENNNLAGLYIKDEKEDKDNADKITKS